MRMTCRWVGERMKEMGGKGMIERVSEDRCLLVIVPSCSAGRLVSCLPLSVGSLPLLAAAAVVVLLAVVVVVVVVVVVALLLLLLAAVVVLTTAAVVVVVGVVVVVVVIVVVIVIVVVVWLCRWAKSCQTRAHSQPRYPHNYLLLARRRRRLRPQPSARPPRLWRQLLKMACK